MRGFAWMSVVCLAAGLVSFEGEATADTAASDCVRFEKEDLDKGLAIDVTNSCEKKLSCAMSYTVTCESNEGQVTGRAQKSTRFSVDANASHALETSAKACTQSWRIDDIRWRCDEAK